MIYLKLFEEFQQLLEIKLDSHWLDRTDQKGQLSRIVRRTSFNLAGWRIVNFIDENRTTFSPTDFLSAVKIDQKDFDKILTEALFRMTRSAKLKNWEPTNSKLENLLRLGKIAVWNGTKKLYVVLAGGNEKGGEFNAGDVLWGVCRIIGNQPNIGKTIKYYPDTEEGNNEAYEDSRKSAGMTKAEYNNDWGISEPYGKKFEIIIDLTDDDFVNILTKIKDQIDGKKITFGPVDKQKKEKEDPFYLSPEFKRITVVKDIELVIEDTFGKKRMYKILDSPKNSEELYKTWEDDKLHGTNNLKKSSVDVKAIEVQELVGPHGVRVSTIGKEKFITLYPGDTVYVKKIKKGEPIDPKVPYTLKWITSEPSILRKGSVQIALDIK